MNSAARWRPRPEMASPFDSPTPISYKWSIDNFRLSVSGFRVNCENVNSAARWRPRPEMTSPFDSPAPISFKWSVDNFRLSSSVQKLLPHFDFLLEIPFGEFS